MKKKFAVCAVAALMALSVSGTAFAEEYTVGILKYMDHASLDQIESSINDTLDELMEENPDDTYNVIAYSGAGETATMQQQAQELIESDCDIIIPIATPAVSVVMSAVEDLDEPIPVVFGAVSDPVGSGIVEDMNEPGGFVTGTSDALDTASILDLMFIADPDLDKVGLLYSLSEDSSTQPIADAKDYLDEKGIEYVEGTGTNTSEIQQAVESLIADDVGAIFTPTDNTVMAAELAIYETLIEAGVPHYTGADSFAVNGAFVGFGVDYAVLGDATATLAVDVLSGDADPATSPVVTFENGIVTVNTETAEALGLDYSGFDEVATQIVEVTTSEEME